MRLPCEIAGARRTISGVLRRELCPADRERAASRGIRGISLSQNYSGGFSWITPQVIGNLLSGKALPNWREMNSSMRGEDVSPNTKKESANGY